LLQVNYTISELFGGVTMGLTALLYSVATLSMQAPMVTMADLLIATPLAFSIVGANAPKANPCWLIMITTGRSNVTVSSS
jgi:hypothetical protein